MMSQTPQPQEPDPFDYNPAYNQLYEGRDAGQGAGGEPRNVPATYCLLYTSDAADD